MEMRVRCLLAASSLTYMCEMRWMFNGVFNGAFNEDFNA